MSCIVLKSIILMLQNFNFRGFCLIIGINVFIRLFIRSVNELLIWELLYKKKIDLSEIHQVIMSLHHQ